MNKYTYEQVLEASTDYFNNDELAAKVFVDKYALQDLSGNYLELTPTDMHHRLAKEFARIEKKYPNPLSEDEIFNLLDKFKFVIPQGSPMFGIGNDYFTQSLGNCFVIESPYDSYGGILKSDQELVQLMKRRAGVGLDISNIRPKGLATKNAAKTTDGIGIFMERFSNSCREVAQSGRRGALMESISINHPEVETFINIKKNKTKVTGANISVRITDEFMNAVKNNEPFTLKWPVDSKSPTITKIIQAKDLWGQIIDSAWLCAEPGILYWDNIIKNSPADIYAKKYPNFKTQSTNPCQPEWATLLTPNGIRQMKDINIGDIIWSGKRWTNVTNKVCTGIKPIYAYNTRAGTFYGTENHRVVSNGSKIEVNDADSIDFCLGDKEIIAPTLDPHHIIDGLIIGDGMMHKASNNAIVLLIGENDQDYFNSEIKDFIIESRFGITKKAWNVKTSIKHLVKTYERQVPTEYLQGTIQYKCGFLRGLYTANGSIAGNRITLKAASIKIIEDVQQMLSSIGIDSYYTVNKSHEVEFENGIYECRESYDLNIGTLYGRQQFRKLIGFIQKDKIDRMNKSCNVEISNKSPKLSYEIVETKFIGDDLVYDITVDAAEHTYWTGGLLVSNCGELPLGLDSCRLLVVNLLSFVDNPFTKKAKFNFPLYKDVCIKAQRLMDDLIDLEIEKINKIVDKIKLDPEPKSVKDIELKLWEQFLESCKMGRRTGTGITALGDCLAALNIKYGSKESIDVTDSIYNKLMIETYRSSSIMAKERGPFPIFDTSLEVGHPFISHVLSQDKELKKLYKNYGRRNISLLTTAPTGSVSTMTQTTSGIEPVFMLSYIRRKKHNPSDKNAKIDFTDALGDSWQEFTVYHHGVKKWMEITGETDITKSPYFGATSNEIDWEASVELQAIAQKSIDHSISKTCNLPENATKELVSQVYMKAWEMGCKGFTVYRDKCRDGVLININESKSQKDSINERPSNINAAMAPKRPNSLPCDIKKVKISGEPWTLFVGLLNDKPYEIFGGLSKYVDIPNKNKSGQISKNGKINGISTYNLIIGEGEDQMIIKDIANVFDNPNFGAFTRTISLALRHGTPVQYVVEQLQKDKYSDMASFSKVIGRVLKAYILDGTKSASDKSCPACNAENSIIYQEGCLSCTSCAYSKCS